MNLFKRPQECIICTKYLSEDIHHHYDEELKYHFYYYAGADLNELEIRSNYNRIASISYYQQSDSSYIRIFSPWNDNLIHLDPNMELNSIQDIIDLYKSIVIFS